MHPSSTDLREQLFGVDLPGLIAELFPESGAKPGRPGTIRAVWRGERHPSCSLFRGKDGMWLFKDHATGESGNAFGFLQMIGAASKTLKTLQSKSSSPAQPPPREQPRGDPARTVRRAQAALARLGGHPQLERRGFSLEEALRLRFGVWRGHLLIPIYNPEGQLQAVKIRHREDQGTPRYRYLYPGCGNPSWYSPNLSQAERVLVVEGELNAAAFHVETGWATVGVPGAEASPNWLLLSGKTVFITADLDPAGKNAQRRWIEEAGRSSLVVHSLPLLPYDACWVRGRGEERWLHRYLEVWTANM